MSLTRYGRNKSYLPSNIFNDFFTSDFNSMFMPLSFYSNSNQTDVATNPMANVYYDENIGYSIELAVPGYSRDEFHVDVENGVLTVGLDGSTEDTVVEKQTVRRREWSYTNFKRSFTLPENTNIDQIDAKYEAGILKINVPTTEAKINKRIIEIS